MSRNKEPKPGKNPGMTNFEKIVQAAQLCHLSMSSLKCQLDVLPFSIRPGDFELDFDVKTKYRVASEQLTVKVVMTLDGRHKAEVEPVLRFEASYLVVYTLNNGEDFAPADLANFAAFNAPFNVYSYFREVVDGNARKMGLEFPILLPLFKPHEIGKQTKKWKSKAVEPD